jgi:SpoVK/Ycf46/Vps4 family AAA+-type ATPase
VGFYIDIDDTQDSEVRKFAIHGLYDPRKDYEVMLKLIKDEIIGLEEIVFPKKEETGFINILIQDATGYGLEQYKLTAPEIDFSINYNEDFLSIHNIILDGLKKQDSKGLVLLYGNPGTGKTTYLKWLINNMGKKVIFIPPNMVNALSDPGFVKFLLAQKNSILVVEDAENILMQRDGTQTNQSVSNILNLTDGILSDCANIQVVATFNTNISKIDKALLRKGRLIAKYEFKELTKDRAGELAKKLGVDIKSQGEQFTLANIYNAQEESFERQDKGKVGFKVGA